MEETIIKQAPRSLQMEVAQQLQREKNFETSLKIGANRMSNGPLKSARFGAARAGQNEHSNAQDEKALKETGKLSDTMKTNQTVDLKEQQAEQSNMIKTMLNTTQKGSLM
jgi:hypothetical protein